MADPGADSGAAGESRGGFVLRVAFALGIGVVGGAVFWWLTLPLPWMMGAMVANVLASILRMPVRSPAKVRRIVSVVIGLMLGSSFTTETLANAAGWIASLAGLAAYLAISALLVVPYYRRIGGYDRITAFFAGMPGGLTEMTFIGKDMGADDRSIVMAHASRIVTVVAIVAITARFLPGYDVAQRQSAGVGWSAVPMRELLILAVGGAAGFWAAKALRLPAFHLLGPMMVSAVLHISGIVTLPPPRELVAVAQVFLGTIVGCRFIGTAPVRILRSLCLGVGATMIMLAITLVFAMLLHGLFGQSTVQILLAYSPGGLAEMSLVALAMDEDIAFVAVHHLARMSLVLMAAPLLFSLWRRKDKGPGD